MDSGRTDFNRVVSDSTQSKVAAKAAALDSAIILCAGSGSRAGLNYNKIFFSLGGATVLEQVVRTFEQCGRFGRIILAASAADLDRVRELFPHHTVVEGGATRSDSVRCALAAARGSRLVAIHDAARPFVTREVIERALDSALRHGSGIPSVKSIDHVCVGSDNTTCGFGGTGAACGDGKCKADGEISNMTAEAHEIDNTTEIAGAVSDALGKDAGGRTRISQYLKKERLYNIQTPQCFSFAEISDAYARVTGSFSDDSEVYMRAGYSPTLTPGDYSNKKLTTPADFVPLSANSSSLPFGVSGLAGLGAESGLLDSLGTATKHENTNVMSSSAIANTATSACSTSACSIGSGFDVHRLVEGRLLILGGVDIPHDKGLLGHSDADVLTHAIADALLSAAGQRDIGVLFPDNDPAFLGLDSFVILGKAAECLSSAGLNILSLSCVIIAQKPKLASFIPQIREKLAEKLGVPAGVINISATTTEFLGIIGEGNAIAAGATVLCAPR